MRKRMNFLPWAGRSSAADVEAEVDEELRFHMEMRARDLESAGLSHDEAKKAAEERFGDVDGIARWSIWYRKTASRRGGGGPAAPGSGSGVDLARWLDELRSDVRHTFRNLIRRPGFAAASILTLGLGIGVTTAAYGLYNTLLVRPIPGLPSDERLVQVKFHRDRPFNFTWVSYPNYKDLLLAATAFEGATGVRSSHPNFAWEGAEPEAVTAELVAHNYFDFLRLPMTTGRGFTLQEGEHLAESRVGVISYKLWHDRMGSDPAVIGKTFHLNRFPYTIVGIGPPGFRGIDRFSEADLWIPAAAYGDVAPFIEPGPDFLGDRARRLFGTVIGRLKEGATVDQAQTQIEATFTALVEEFPEENELMQGITPRVHPDVAESISFTTESLRSTFKLLAWIVTGVLLISAANAANLLFSRSLARRDEIGVRRALGASRRRLYRQFITESVVLGVLGGAVGLAVSLGLTRWLQISDLGIRVPEIERMQVDLSVLGFTMLVAVLVGVLAGLGSTLVGSRTKVEGLGHRGATVGRWHRRLRDGFTVAQFGISVVVLISALLLARSISNIRNTDYGFDLSGLATFQISLDSHQYSDSEEEDFYRRLRDALNEMPAVGTWAAVTPTPFGGVRSRGRILVEGTLLEGSEERSALFPETAVTSGYFDTLGIPLVRGRTFGDGDMEFGRRPRLEVIVSQQLGRELFGDEDPLGKMISVLGNSREYVPLPVVGVVPDISVGARAAAEPTLYVPFEHASARGSSTLLIGPPDLKTGITAVRDSMRSIDPTLPVFVATMLERLDGRIQSPRTLAEVAAFLAALALALASVGLFAVVSFSVTERTREFGIRIALGAVSKQVITIVVRRALTIAALGVTLGLAAAWTLTRYLGSRLYEVEADDPLVFGLASLLLLSLGVIASIQPARRATRVDPLLAIRSE